MLLVISQRFLFKVYPGILSKFDQGILLEVSYDLLCKKAILPVLFRKKKSKCFFNSSEMFLQEFIQMFFPDFFQKFHQILEVSKAISCEFLWTYSKYSSSNYSGKTSRTSSSAVFPKNQAQFTPRTVAEARTGYFPPTFFYIFQKFSRDFFQYIHPGILSKIS